MKSVIVQTNTKRENILNVSEAEAKQVMLDKIRNVIALRRKEVENALISSGSPKAVRSLGYKAFNSAVMNRLSAPGVAGDDFRSDITKLVTVLFGGTLAADGFFRTKNNKNQRASFMGSNMFLSPDTAEGIISANENILDKKETASGGVEKSNSGENVGSILSGSAQVIDSVGGIIGLFTGGSSQTANNNSLNTSGDNNLELRDESKGSKLPWIIGGLVVVAAIVGVVIYMKKKK